LLSSPSSSLWPDLQIRTEPVENSGDFFRILCYLRMPGSVQASPSAPIDCTFCSDYWIVRARHACLSKAIVLPCSLTASPNSFVLAPSAFCRPYHLLISDFGMIAAFSHLVLWRPWHQLCWARRRQPGCCFSECCLISSIQALPTSCCCCSSVL
jgi:hypothetical protein